MDDLVLVFPLPEVTAETGIAKVELRALPEGGSYLSVTGWFDMFASWVSQVELEPEQVAALHEATRPAV